MRILVVAATSQEIAPLVALFGPARARHPRVHSYQYAGHTIDTLETGVGMVATAVWCSTSLVNGRYELALNLGVCGSFDPALEPGRVVHVTSELLSELGAEDGDHFLTMQELGLIREDEPPFVGGRLLNSRPPANEALAALASVRGITVNTVHGKTETIAAIARRLSPQVESMEGAAFMYACLVQSVPFAEIRGVSNMVERRERERWKMKEAIANLCETARRLIETL